MYLTKEEVEGLIDQDNYFVYETGDSTTHANGKLCDEIRFMLYEHGYELYDIDIHHDTIGGYVIELKEEENL